MDVRQHDNVNVVRIEAQEAHVVEQDGTIAASVEKHNLVAILNPAAKPPFGL
jgi:hypothetical protein